MPRSDHKNKFLAFLSVNVLVINYGAAKMEITVNELSQVLKSALADEAVAEKYVRDFLNCSAIDRSSARFPIDKLMFIYQYGSKKAKRIAVDEKLKMR